jgi:AraC family transcriptional regulator, transcriptional activator FtrA
VLEFCQKLQTSASGRKDREHQKTVMHTVATIAYDCVNPFELAVAIEMPLPVPHENEPFGETLAWMASHLAEDLTVEQMAARAVMSPRTFARRFHATLGTTPYQWLLQQRIIMAQRLLETTGEPIERIAECCGFGSAATLRLHFQRLLHISPQTYRHAFHREKVAESASKVHRR